MHVVVAYDIREAKTRRKLFRMLSGLGIHAQLSVFECDLGHRQQEELLCRAGELLDGEDSLLLYPLCPRCSRGAWVLGKGIRVVSSGWQVI